MAGDFTVSRWKRSRPGLHRAEVRRGMYRADISVESAATMEGRDRRTGWGWSIDLWSGDAVVGSPERSEFWHATARDAKEASIINAKELLQRRASNSIPTSRDENIGREWGNKRVVDRRVVKSLGDVYVVKTEGSTTYTLIPVGDLESDIDFDERAAASARRMREAREVALAEEAAEQREYDFTYGFADRFSPIRRRRIIETLNKTVRSGDKYMTRKQLVVDRVRRGWITQENRRGDVRLVSPDGHYLSRVDITKTGLDFARYLIDNPEALGRTPNPIPSMPGGSVSGCITKMKRERKDIDEPGAYCAAIADRIEPGWRKKRSKNMIPIRKQRIPLSTEWFMVVKHEPVEDQYAYELRRGPHARGEPGAAPRWRKGGFRSVDDVIMHASAALHDMTSGQFSEWRAADIMRKRLRSENPTTREHSYPVWVRVYFPDSTRFEQFERGFDGPPTESELTSLVAEFASGWPNRTVEVMSVPGVRPEVRRRTKKKNPSPHKLKNRLMR